MQRSNWRFRIEPCPADRDRIAELVAATGFFSSDEIVIAVELLEERLQKGLASGYEFILADADARLLGYACFGPIPGAHGCYDLYWIAVQPEQQRTGLGRELLAGCEAAIRQAGGRRLYIDTSGRAHYAPTRTFYAHCGYRREAVLPDFYAPGDDKIIFCKALV